MAPATLDHTLNDHFYNKAERYLCHPPSLYGRKEWVKIKQEEANKVQRLSALNRTPDRRTIGVKTNAV